MPMTDTSTGAVACPCPICEGSSVPFGRVDFGKSCSAAATRETGRMIDYRRCERCGFIWAPEFRAYSPADFAEQIYNDGYLEADPEFLTERPRGNVAVIASTFGRRGTVGLDYGGGRGETARLMRARGWHFDCFDPFGADEVTPADRGRYNLVTAFEVFEHSPDPLASMKEALRLTNGKAVFMISTLTSDGEVGEGLDRWWYAAPRNGHISLFSRDALAQLAGRLGLGFASVSPAIHLMWEGNRSTLLMKLRLWASSARRRLGLYRDVRA